MSSPILGLHHVTATVDDAQADLDFAMKLLGLRLVKKTVNFDNPSVYHFYYGDERGTPGTIWTTFPYKDKGVRVGSTGAGQITAMSFSIPAAALDFWRSRLAGAGYTPAEQPPRFGERSLLVRDPSGLSIELVATSRDTREPWIGGRVNASTAIRGVHSVTLTVRTASPTVAFMTELLGFERIDQADRRTRMAVGGDGPGRTMDILEAPDLPAGINGLGTVHHVAMAVADAEDQLRMRMALVQAGCQVTAVLDRQYFKSIYFREPGGVLFEIATMQPGFDADEPIARLGKDLKLPPWEEPNRAGIESVLPPVVY
jgi:glyoxalase family protein